MARGFPDGKVGADGRGGFYERDKEQGLKPLAHRQTPTLARKWKVESLKFKEEWITEGTLLISESVFYA